MSDCYLGLVISQNRISGPHKRDWKLSGTWKMELSEQVFHTIQLIELLGLENNIYFSLQAIHAYIKAFYFQPTL